MLPLEDELEISDQYWDSFADCGCHYLYKEDNLEEGHIFVAPCNNNSIMFWEEKTLSWFDFNMYARDEGHADLSIL